jgi:hypothetical protein
MQADVGHIKYRMAQENFFFEIVELGGAMGKKDRIRQLIPVFERHGWYVPAVISYRNYEGAIVDIMHDFVQEEYVPFPVGLHDDMLDCKARIMDPDLKRCSRIRMSILN